MNEAETLAAYIKTIEDFPAVEPLEPYGHMGATLTDAILQAGIDYEKVVLPRAEKIQREYPEARTTSGFAKVIEQFGINEILNWAPGAKPDRLLELVKLLLQFRIETEDELRIWLEIPRNLEELREIKGIKNKTANYLQILVGSQSAAPDVHLFRFLEEAGLPINTYPKAQRIIADTAALIGVPQSLLDRRIWLYMSTRSSRPGKVLKRAYNSAP